MPHMVLLGDSIFDNGKYVPDGPSVIEHVRQRLPGEWQATLLAVDKTTCEGVPAQVAKVPADATHLVVSIGGNDALRKFGIVFSGKSAAFYEVAEAIAAVRGEFSDAYRQMLPSLLACRLPTTVCTIYDSLPILNPTAKAALSLFNDVILREAFYHRLNVIDLRYVCPETADYSSLSPMEPSASGGAKVATAIIRAVAQTDVAAASRVIY